MDLTVTEMIIISLLVTVIAVVLTVGLMVVYKTRQFMDYLRGRGRWGVTNRRRDRDVRIHEDPHRGGEGEAPPPPPREENNPQEGGVQTPHGAAPSTSTAIIPLLSPAATTREEIEAYAQQIRTSAANRRRTEREERHKRSVGSGDPNEVSGASGNSNTDTDTGTARTTASAAATDAEEFECSICLCEAEAAVEFLPCGHTFCGKCAQQLWRHGGILRQMRCPLDRTVVEAIVPEFNIRETMARRRRVRESETEEATQRTNDVREVRGIDADLARYNNNNTRRTISGVLSLAARAFSIARFLPVLIKIKVFLLFVAPLLYTISPIDLIPEMVFGVIGYLDDLVIILVAIVALSGVARNALGIGGA